MTRLAYLCAGLALLAARPCLAEAPGEDLARLRAEIAKLRKENAALKKELEALAPPRSNFQGVLRERSFTLQIAPQMAGIGAHRQETRLVLDMGNLVFYDLAFKREEEQKVRSWKGQKVLVRGAAQIVPGNPFAKELMFPPLALPVPARFSTFRLELNPPGRRVLVVESWCPVVLLYPLW